ncbi:MAG: M24 family metallopeptidase [Hymenobacter sp.]
MHYASNDRQCQDGDVLLMDFGAEYANYAADLSRSIPVNRARSQPRQRQVYEAVLRVFRISPNAAWWSAMRLRPTTKPWAQTMEQELIKLDLLNAADVQEPGPRRAALQEIFPARHQPLPRPRRARRGLSNTANSRPAWSTPNEPGIYIREEKLGIRLENDILITATGNEDLMAAIPLELTDIEQLMKLSCGNCHLSCSINSLISRRLRNSMQMLLRQAFRLPPRIPSPIAAHLLFGLRHGHFVNLLDGHVGVLGAVFDQRQAAGAGPQGPA